MDSKSPRQSNKIRDIVRLQQILKKWKKLANNRSSRNCTTSSTSSNSSGSRSIKFLKKTLSFSESSSSALGNEVPKGYIAVCVGKELKRYAIPTEYLRHQVFGTLLREAEEEFGFQQQGVLKFPCEVDLFEKILKIMEGNEKNTSITSSSDAILLPDHQDLEDSGFVAGDHDPMTTSINNHSSPDTQVTELTPSHHHHPAQTCR